MKSETELSDKEWRQMRRQMSKLDFDPVPETPALVPRSLYGDSDKDLVSICEERGEKPEETRESAALDDGGSTHNDSPKNRSPNAINQEMPEKISIKIGSELPSTSMAVSPLITNRYRPREKKLSHKAKLDDADIAVLDAQMAMAQEATRRSIMGAFMELRAKKAKSEALERTELSAAHMSDVASLQRKVEDLKMQVSGAEIQREQQDLLLDRFSEFTAKQLNKNQMRWGEDRSRDICFRVWNKAAQRSAAKRNALRRVLGQSCKRQLLASLCHWKKNVQAFVLQKLLQDQRDRYEHRIVEMAKEYQLRIHQLQQEIDEAKCQVAESQKCRQKLEEDLRLIFLRGVSAMNIEALTAFGSSHKQVGIEEQHPAPRLGLREEEFQEGFDRLNAEILNDGEEEDGIDLEGYEEYLERLKR
ncbi:centrosomal protein POC5-like isoform X1 [Phytophthora cinnamomi]|uniref:centrosomal protein POC5-like isoform X1 n=1 Tax=Phytophthora cinnamomi TaxID=4785 RepID=UPI00355ACBCE|nr:centrosomal protein POC5-like isoform X1 [Phytophthora cinnamomi]